MTTAIDMSADVTFKADTMRVVHNMTKKIQGTRLEIDYDKVAGEHPDHEAYLAAVKKITSSYQANHAEMMRTFTMAIEYLSTPGVRLWPDNGREDCLSLSGSLHGMGFGIIWRENADGTGSWSFHS